MADAAARKHAEGLGFKPSATAAAAPSSTGHHPAVAGAAGQEAAGGGVAAAERPRGATSPTAAVAPLPLQWGVEKGPGGPEPRGASQLRARAVGNTSSSAQNRGSR